MPALFQDQIDDPITFDVCTSFIGGMASNVRANLLAPEQAALMVNMDISKVGEAITRRGTSRLGTSKVGDGSSPYGIGTYVQLLVQYYSSTSNYLVGLNGGRLWTYNEGGNSWSATTTAFTAIQNAGPGPTVAHGVDKLYICEGSAFPLGNVYSWDGTTVVNISGTSPNPPPQGPRSLVWYTNRLIAGAFAYSPGIATPDQVAFSDILDGSNFVPSNSIRVGGGDGEQIYGLCPWLDFNLIVVKRHSIWVVNCDPSIPVSGFEIKPIHTRVGSIYPRTFVQVGSDVYGLTDNGVRSMKRTAAVASQSDLGPSLSFPVDDIIARITPGAESQCCATYWNNRYILSMPLDGATLPSHLLVYNTLTQSWTGYWTGLSVTCFAIRQTSTGSKTRLVMGMADGTAMEWLDYVPVASEVTATFQDALLAGAANIASRLTSRAMNFQEIVCKKTGLNTEVEYTSPGTLTGQLVIDGANFGSTVSLSSGQTRKAFDTMAAGQFRELQLDLVSTSGKQQIRNIQASGFVESMILQT